MDWGPDEDGWCVQRRLRKPRGRSYKTWESVHDTMVSGYEKPNKSEGFDEILEGPKKYRVYAVDFDGTMVKHDFPEIGEQNNEMIAKMREWWEDKSNLIIIWTCRSGDYECLMREWLLKNNIPFDFINENPVVNMGGPKIFAHEYWDDRGVNVNND